MKRRNCNLELRLLPSSSSATMMEESIFEQQQQRQQQQQQKKQLTIFYKGKISVCDVTELQARAIILLASRETEERMRSPTGGSSSVSQPSSPLSLPSQLCSPATGLSMKRSLQRFLQKRKSRIESTSPYHQ